MAEHREILHLPKRDRTKPKPGAPETRRDGHRITINFRVNGDAHRLEIEPRLTLIEALRGRLGLTGIKKGCDGGECGECTVLIDGQRLLACMKLAVHTDGKSITTVDGLARGGEL